MKPENQENQNPYDQYAGILAEAYDQVKTTDVMPFLAEILPPAPRNRGLNLSALDLGCGSGRDSYWLAHKKKFHVTAIDNSSGMLKHAKQKHSHPNIEYIKDTLPHIKKLHKTARKFDVILLSAVLMHFAKSDREKIFQNMIKLIKPNGLIYITLRCGTHAADRSLYKVPIKEVESFCKKNKITLEDFGRINDARGRAGISWHHVAVRL